MIPSLLQLGFPSLTGCPVASFCFCAYFLKPLFWPSFSVAVCTWLSTHLVLGIYVLSVFSVYSLPLVRPPRMCPCPLRIASDTCCRVSFHSDLLRGAHLRCSLPGCPTFLVRPLPCQLIHYILFSHVPTPRSFQSPPPRVLPSRSLTLPPVSQCLFPRHLPRLALFDFALPLTGRFCSFLLCAFLVFSSHGDPYF